MIFQHPLAYLVGVEGAALLRAWGGEYDEQFVVARLNEIRQMFADEALVSHPGVQVEPGATDDAYRTWATTYDDPDNGLLELDLPFIDAILDRLAPGVAVDTACGTGRLTRRLAARGHQVLGADSSREMLEEARRKLPDVEFVLADMDDLPLPDASVDLVTNALALTHIADPRRVLAEWARVLRPGGSAIVTDVHPELSRLGSVPKARRTDGRAQQAACHPHGVADLLRAALSVGFQVRGFDELPHIEATTADAAPPARREIGEWRDWPWSLLGWAPEASRAAWAVPSMIAWHLELGCGSAHAGSS